MIIICLFAFVGFKNSCVLAKGCQKLIFFDQIVAFECCNFSIDFPVFIYVKICHNIIWLINDTRKQLKFVAIEILNIEEIELFFLSLPVLTHTLIN